MIPFRNLLPPTNSQKTKPAYQAMNGRKQIVRGINGIKPDHGLIPESVCHNLRSGIGRRKQDKKTETDNPGYCICCKKVIYTLFFLSRNQNVIDSPKQITSKIDYQCPGYERDPLIQHSLNIVMICPDAIHLAPLYASEFHNTASKSGTIPYAGISFFLTLFCLYLILPAPSSPTFDSV